jgi:hypothetical protein
MLVQRAAKDGINPVKIGEEKKARDKKCCEVKKPPDCRLFPFQVHENRADQTDFKGSNDQSDDNVAMLRAEVDVRRKTVKAVRKRSAAPIP